MQSVKMRFNHTDICKPSVCFTWDDNCAAHRRLIAPQFLKRGFLCTFYINPGEAGFKENYMDSYKALSESNFEIGSHGFCHDDYSNMPKSEFEHELKRSALSIKESLGIYPATFAFPYHAFNDDMLQTARKLYLETRNTLRNSKRFGIRTSSTLDEMMLAARECVSNKRSLVFSGHSAVPAADGNIKEDAGHEPIPVQTLSALLEYLQTQDGAEVLTFGQAALKQFIIDNCEISGSFYTLSGEQADRLGAFQIGAGKLERLI